MGRLVRRQEHPGRGSAYRQRALGLLRAERRGAGFGGFPSPSQCINDFSHHQSFLYFDPPVRSVSFWYASDIHDGNNSEDDSIPDDAFFFIAIDTAGFTVEFDSIYANQDPPSSWPDHPRDDWTQLTISAGDEDRIYKIHFEGYMVIDDLVIVRAPPPAIECDTVTRGISTTCSIRPEVLAGLDSANAVTDWKFTGVKSDGSLTSVQGPSWVDSWSGVAVQSGDVEAVGWAGPDSIPLHGELIVDDRTGSEWTWALEDWDFADDSAMVGCPIPNWNTFGPSDSTTLEVNLRRTSCAPNSVEPVVADLSGDPGFTSAQVTDGGPNDGLWYVTAATYWLDRGSLINPSILPGYQPDVLGKKDSKNCPDSLRVGPNDAAVVNFYQYNTLCQVVSLQPLYDGIHRHEGFGTSGQLNGHEARRRLGAANPANYPAAAVEGIVGSDSANLDFLGRIAVDGVDVVITEDSDPLHILVNGNFSTSVFARSQTGQGNYKLRVVDDAN